MTLFAVLRSLEILLRFLLEALNLFRILDIIHGEVAVQRVVRIDLVFQTSSGTFRLAG